MHAGVRQTYTETTMKFQKTQQLLAAAGLATLALSAHAVEWSENILGARFGSTFAEPGIPGSSISKSIYSFTHVSGDKLGKNLVLADVLLSNDKDPGVGGSGGAQEFYGLYRRTFSLSKMTGKPFAFGPFKDMSLVGRVDFQTKNIQFAPRARKVIGGVSFDFDVPKGFIESGIYAYSESNHNGIVGKDVSFKTTYLLDTSWLIPFNAGVPAKWSGSLAYTGPKGKDGFNADTKGETRLFTSVMFDVGTSTGFAVGVGFEAWRNKYGNDQSATPGAKHNTVLLLAEYRM